MNETTARDGLVTAPPPAAVKAEEGKSDFLTTLAWFRDLMLSVLIAVLVILFLVPARKGGRYEHDADTLRPGTAVHQPVQL